MPFVLVQALRMQKMTLSVFNDVKGGPEPSEKLIRKVLVPIGRF